MSHRFRVPAREAAFWAAIGEILSLLSLIGNLFIFRGPAFGYTGLESRIISAPPIMIGAALAAFFFFLYQANGDIPSRTGFRIAARLAGGGMLLGWAIAFRQMYQSYARRGTLGSSPGLSGMQIVSLGMLFGLALVVFLFTAARESAHPGTGRSLRITALVALILGVLGLSMSLYRFPVLIVATIGAGMRQPIEGWLRPAWSCFNSFCGIISQITLLLLLLAMSQRPLTDDPSTAVLD